MISDCHHFDQRYPTEFATEIVAEVERPRADALEHISLQVQGR